MYTTLMQHERMCPTEFRARSHLPLIAFEHPMTTKCPSTIRKEIRDCHVHLARPYRRRVQIKPAQPLIMEVISVAV